MAIDARNRPLPDWFTRIRTHQITLPRFQRFEAWGYANVTQIFNTILQELPVGSLLVLEIGNEEPFISRTLQGAPVTGDRVTEHLLDGQQRLTALWRGLHNNYEERTYFLYMLPDDETALPYYVDSIARWRKKGDTEPRPFWANKPPDQWERKMIPLDLCAPGEAGTKQFREWARLAISDRDERDEINDKISLIREKFAAFNLPYLSLPVTTKKDTALDVFIKKIYVSLNCAVVTWRTNRNISDKEPERYLAERREGTALGETEVRARLASHLIPYDEMVNGDYKAFLEARAELMHSEMITLCGTGGS